MEVVIFIYQVNKSHTLISGNKRFPALILAYSHNHFLTLVLQNLIVST